jgi:hypothetical protein
VFTTQWQRLFGPRWATSQSGRGLKALLRVLGRSATDGAARTWVVRRVGEGCGSRLSSALLPVRFVPIRRTQDEVLEHRGIARSDGTYFAAKS